jgi:DNA-binding NarL/FixJ family response regulator
MRIILADHHAHALSALQAMIGEEPGLEVIGAVVDVDRLIQLADTTTPDLVLMDWELPGKPIQELISSLHALKPKPYVIVMSSTIESSRKLIKAGADAFVSKSDQPDFLVEILRDQEKQYELRRLSQRNEDSSASREL